MYATRKALGTAARALSAAEPGAWALRPSGWCSSRRRHLFTGGVQRDKRPLVIALDLDETLVHSYFGAEGDRDLRQREARPEYDVAEVAELVAEAADSAGEPLLSIDVDGIDVTVAPRPGLRDFFAWLHHAEAAGVAEAWMFTSAQPRYATRVLAALQHVGSLPRPSNGRPGLLGPERRLFRADCTMRSIPTVPMGDAERETGPNVLYLKDLRTLLRADARRHKLKDELISTDISENERNFLERVVLVDNSPVLCLPQPDNGIPIAPWFGYGVSEDEMEAAAADNVLQLLSVYLEELIYMPDGKDDVRVALIDKFHLRRHLSASAVALGLIDDVNFPEWTAEDAPIA